jgi:hypothetical protein
LSDWVAQQKDAAEEAETVLRDLDASLEERAGAAEGLRLAWGLEPWHVRYPQLVEDDDMEDLEDDPIGFSPLPQDYS